MCTVIVNVHTDRCPFFFLFISISSNNTFRADIFHHFHGGTKFSGHHFLCFSFRFGSLTLSQPFFFPFNRSFRSVTYYRNTFIHITNLVALDLFIVEVF